MELTLERLLEHITQAAEFQRRSQHKTDAFERYLSATLHTYEEAYGPQARWAREAIDAMRINPSEHVT